MSLQHLFKKVKDTSAPESMRSDFVRNIVTNWLEQRQYNLCHSRIFNRHSVTLNRDLEECREASTMTAHSQLGDENNSKLCFVSHESLDDDLFASINFLPDFYDEVGYYQTDPITAVDQYRASYTRDMLELSSLQDMIMEFEKDNSSSFPLLRESLTS